jgi:hypothetical protein
LLLLYAFLQILKALSALLPCESFLQPDNLQELTKLVQIDATSASFQSECIVLKNFLTSKLEKKLIESNLHAFVAIVADNRDAFPLLHKLYAAGLTFGASTASYEASFSTLTRILTPYRLSMTYQRKTNLVILSFNSSYANGICLDMFCVNFQNLAGKSNCFDYTASFD